jgi:hypothetical protein
MALPNNELKVVFYFLISSSFFYLLLLKQKLKTPAIKIAPKMTKLKSHLMIIIKIKLKKIYVLN